VTSVEVHSVNDGRYRSVQVNGHDEDLAYLYIRAGSDSWRNVSKVVGCPSTGVTGEFKMSPSGSVTAVQGKLREAVGTVVGVEEGEHARCILKTGNGRMELRPGSDFKGRCRDLIGAEVRIKYSEEPSAEAESEGDAFVLHEVKVLRPERPPPPKTTLIDPY
jgi:hypothetical protein